MIDDDPFPLDFNANDLSAAVLVPIGPFSQEIRSPKKANGARISLQRQSWPDLGLVPLFSWSAYEQERSGSLELLASGNEFGGDIVGKGGVVNPPLVITLTWAADKDKETIRLDLLVNAPFNTVVSLEWL